MIERTPSSAPEGPAPEPEPPGPAPKSVSLILRPATTGGVVISFVSPATGAIVVHHFPELEMSAEWSQIPLYVSEYLGNHVFTIWHPGAPVAAPAGPPSPSGEDQAALDAFEEHFEAMDLEVQQNVSRTRALPPPPPSAPGSRRFYRATGNAGGDADQDGTPDWLEFAMAAAGGAGSTFGDPFNADTDGNGLPDGHEADADGDGIANAIDVAPGDGAIKWQKGDHPLFAMFPVTGTGAVAHVNDQGRVLYTGSVWSNGVPAVLNPASSTLLSDCYAIGIGDNGFILGIGFIDLPGNAGESKSPCMVTWPAAGGDPIALKEGDSYLVPVGMPSPGSNHTGGFPPPSDMNVNPDGKFVAFLGKKFSGPGPDGTYFTLEVDGDDPHPRKIWQGTAGTPAVTRIAVAGEQTLWIASNDLHCGMDENGRFKAGDHVFDGDYNRIAELPGGGLGAFSPGGLNPFVRTPPGSAWGSNGTLKFATDISTEGRFAIQTAWRV